MGGRVPDLIPDSDTGAAEDMVTKTVDRLTADTVATGPITRNLLRTQKAIIKALSVSLLIQNAGPVTDGEVIR